MRLRFDEDAGAFGLFAGVFFFEFVEGAEALSFEAAFREWRFAGAWIVEADKEDADFAFFALEADADGHFADDVNDAGFGQRGVELLDAERKFIVDANHFGTNCHSREKIYAWAKCASEEEVEFTGESAEWEAKTD
jgi:hypothetical protein